MVPDSEEDDTLHSGTSWRDSSPPRRVQRQRKSSRSRTQAARVIQDSDDDGLSGLDQDALNRPVTNNDTTIAVKVVIPSKKDVSPSDSCGSSGIRSADGTTACTTPATSIGTPAESSIKRARGRVNASDRAQSLRTSTMTRRASLRGQRGLKRSAEAAALSEDEANPETSDAAIAYALQMEEYEQHEQPPPKKQKTSAPKRSWRTTQTISEILETSSDSELSQWSHSEDDLDFESDSDEGVRQERDGDEQDDSDAYRRALAAEDEDDLALSWEEQRKARRVSSIS